MPTSVIGGLGAPRRPAILCVSGQDRVRRSNIRLPRFLDRVYVESQYKGHPVHTPGDLLRFLQIGPDDRTNTLEWRESCSLLSWFAAKFQKNRRLCFVDCPKEVVLSSRICQQCCAHSIRKCSEMKGVHVVVVVRQYQCPGKRKRSKNWCGFQESPRRAPKRGPPRRASLLGEQLGLRGLGEFCFDASENRAGRGRGRAIVGLYM